MLKDLKLENILIKNKGNNDYIVKLTDYGVSKQVTGTICKTHTGTPQTMAPEILEGKAEYDNKCDLWSIGIIIYQLLFNEYPYKGVMEIALLNEIKKNGQKFFKKSEDNNLNQLIRRLLIKDSKERMTWEEYFDHPFFTDKKYEAFEASEASESSTKNISNKSKIGRASCRERV